MSNKSQKQQEQAASLASTEPAPPPDSRSDYLDRCDDALDIAESCIQNQDCFAALEQLRKAVESLRMVLA